MDELKQLFQELLMILEENGDHFYDLQIKILKRVLKIIDGNENDLDKFSQVACEYKKLFSQKVDYQNFMFGRMILLKEKRRMTL